MFNPSGSLCERAFDLARSPLFRTPPLPPASYPTHEAPHESILARRASQAGKTACLSGMVRHGTVHQRIRP